MCWNMETAQVENNLIYSRYIYDYCKKIFLIILHLYFFWIMGRIRYYWKRILKTFPTVYFTSPNSRVVEPNNEIYGRLGIANQAGQKNRNRFQLWFFLAY
jgi:hypothetical protein